MNAPATAAPQPITQPQVEGLLNDVFKLMEYPATLEFKDMTDGSLAVAVHFSGELPGITPGKRSYLLDQVQFWLNKVVNRPNVPRRWVNLGVNAFPEPRQQQQQQPKEPVTAKVPAPVASAPAARASAGGAVAAKKPAAAPPPAPVVKHESKRVDERTLTPAPNPAWTAVAKLLAEKSAKHGRLYGVMGLTADQRALMLQATDGMKGVTAKAEGEGHWRRLVMTPEKLTVIPKKQVMPDYDDEEDDEE